jgi:transcriptional regulator with XRE-family HTH domain
MREVVAMEAAAGTRIRERRQALGLSLRDLGSRVGVSASMLSQVENGRCRASVATLYKLVSELGMTLDDLFDDADLAPAGAPGSARTVQPTPVLSPGERVTIELESGVTWEKLSNAAPPGLEFILVTYRPGSSSGKSGKFSQHEGFECAYVESGELTFHHKFDTFTLRAGDTITFDASEPHRLENLGTDDARAVWIVLDGPAVGSGAVNHSQAVVELGADAERRPARVRRSGAAG